MDQTVNLVVPASGGKVEVVFPVSLGSRHPTTLTFDIPAPGGTIIINLTPNAVQAVGVDASCSRSKSSSQQSGSPTPAPMLFSSLPLPTDKPTVMKYTPLPRPEVKPRISSYVPIRSPSPEPDVFLENPPPIPADLSDNDLLLYGYLIDDKFCKEKGFVDSFDASDDIGDCIDELRISAFVKMADSPDNDDIEFFYFALRGPGSIVRTIGNRGVPSVKLKELEAKKGLKSACWISFEEVSQLPK